MTVYGAKEATTESAFNGLFKLVFKYVEPR